APQCSRCLRMEVRLGLLDSKDGLYSRPVRFRELLEHRGLKQEDYSKALETLAVMTQGEPRSQFLVSNHDPCSLQHVFDRYRQCIHPCSPWPLSDSDPCCLSNLLRNLVQAWVCGHDASIKFTQCTQRLTLQFVGNTHAPQQAAPVSGTRRKFV